MYTSTKDNHSTVLNLFMLLYISYINGILLDNLTFISCEWCLLLMLLLSQHPENLENTQMCPGNFSFLNMYTFYTVRVSFNVFEILS